MEINAVLDREFIEAEKRGAVVLECLAEVGDFAVGGDAKVKAEAGAKGLNAGGDVALGEE